MTIRPHPSDTEILCARGDYISYPLAVWFMFLGAPPHWLAFWLAITATVRGLASPWEREFVHERLGLTYMRHPQLTSFTIATFFLVVALLTSRLA